MGTRKTQHRMHVAIAQRECPHPHLQACLRAVSGRVRQHCDQLGCRPAGVDTQCRRHHNRAALPIARRGALTQPVLQLPAVVENPDVGGFEVAGRKRCRRGFRRVHLALAAKGSKGRDHFGVGVGQGLGLDAGARQTLQLGQRALHQLVHGEPVARRCRRRTAPARSQDGLRPFEAGSLVVSRPPDEPQVGKACHAGRTDQALFTGLLHRQIDEGRVAVAQPVRHRRPLACQHVGQPFDKGPPGGVFQGCGFVRAHGLRLSGASRGLRAGPGLPAHRAWSGRPASHRCPSPAIRPN